MEARVIAAPPHRQEDRADENVAGALVVVLVEHGPFERFVVHLALDFRRAGRFDLLPGAFHDALVVGDRFLAAEPFHLVGDTVDQLDGHILQGLAAGSQVFHGKSLQEIILIVLQAGRQRIGELDLERVTRHHRGGILLDHAKQDHGHDLVERLFHQDGGFDRRQAALDAVSFDLDLRRQVIEFAFPAAGGAQDRNAHEQQDKEPETTKSGAVTAKPIQDPADVECRRYHDGARRNVVSSGRRPRRYIAWSHWRWRTARCR